MSSLVQPTSAAENMSVRTAAARKNNWRRYLPLYLSIAPYFIIFLAFNFTPTIFSLYLSFHKWDGIGRMTFTGFNNFYFALTDPIFGKAVLNTFEIWILSTIPMLFLALVLAFLLNQRRRSKFAYQLCYFLPNITSIVAIALIFGSLFAPQYGLINTTLIAIHLPAVQWLQEAWPMKWAVALMVIWRWTGYNALVYMAGLQSIPEEFYEAARIDGANTTNIFFSVTLPLLRPVILFTVISSSIGGLALFTEPQVLFPPVNGVVTGGPGNEAMTMVLYQYGQAFASHHFGFGAAVSWVIFVIMLTFTFMNWKIVQSTEH